MRFTPNSAIDIRVTKPRDHYAVLGVARNANAKAIKTAYRRRMRELHPDTAGRTVDTDEIAAVFCASKKSLAAGAPMAALIFGAHPGLGLILLPIMIYHPLQLIVCSIMAESYSSQAKAAAAKSPELVNAR